MKPAKDGGTLPGDLMTQEILQTRDQKQPIEGQSKIKQDRVGLAKYDLIPEFSFTFIKAVYP
jgi:hypothetical protein